MKILCVGDPHYKTSNRDETDEFESKLEKAIIKHNPDLIVLLGDIYDRHETIHLSPHRRICHWIEKLLTYAPVVMLVGNHDRKNNRDYLGPDHSLVPFKQWNNVTVVDKPMKMDFEEGSFGFVPYVPPGRFREALTDYLPEWKDMIAIFGHQEFKGAQMGVTISTEGDSWKGDYPLVVSGHIHDYQIVGNVIYTGTPFQHTFGENRDKTVSLFDITSQNITHLRIKLHCRQKRVITMTAAEVPSYQLEGNSLCKIKIIGPFSILKHPQVISWKNKGHLIVSQPEATITKKDTIVKITSNFRQLLEDKMRQEGEEVRRIYMQLYGDS